MLTLHSNPPYSSQGSLPMSRPLNSSSTLGAPLSTDDILLPPGRPYAQPANRMSTSSVLSVDTIVGDKKDFKLQKVEPFFTDSTGEYYRVFEGRLQGLNGSNSESHLCIEEFLEKSEKKWFDKFRDARLGLNNNNNSQFFKGKRFSTSVESLSNDESDSRDSAIYVTKEGDEFLLGKDYVPPTGIKKWMQVRIGDWPVYSLFLGLGKSSQPTRTRSPCSRVKSAKPPRSCTVLQQPIWSRRLSGGLSSATSSRWFVFLFRGSSTVWRLL